MMFDQPQYQNAIARIRVGYVSTLRDHLENLTRLHARIVADDARLEAFSGVHDVAHKIHGVAKTLQYDDLGRIAAEVEHALPPAPMTAAQFEFANARLCDLIACITDICADTDPD
jgi:HPt (histidine-containing phosphotransfer) domain-containing protein